MSGITLYTQHDGTITRNSARELRAYGVPATGSTTLRAAKAAAKKAGLRVTVAPACPSTPTHNTPSTGFVARKIRAHTAAKLDALYSL